MKPPNRASLTAWLVVALVSLVLALLPILAGAGSRLWATYESPGLTVELYTSPCDYPRVEAWLKARVPEGAVRSAVVMHGGAAFPGCWMFDASNIVLADVTGNAGQIPAKDVKQDLV